MCECKRVHTSVCIHAGTRMRACAHACIPCCYDSRIRHISTRRHAWMRARARAHTHTHTHTMQHTHLCAQMTLTLKIFNNRRPPQPDVPRDFPLLRSPLLPPLFCLPHFFREGAPPPHPAQHRLCMRLRVCMYVHMRTRSVAGIHSPHSFAHPHIDAVWWTHTDVDIGTDTQAHRHIGTDTQTQTHRHTDTQTH